jgi:hypothetical protein
MGYMLLMETTNKKRDRRQRLPKPVNPVLGLATDVETQAPAVAEESFFLSAVSSDKVVPKVDLIATVQVVHYWPTEKRRERLFSSKKITIADTAKECLLKGEECIPVWDRGWALVCEAAAAYRVVLQTIQYMVDDDGKPAGLNLVPDVVPDSSVATGSSIARLRHQLAAKAADKMDYFRHGFSGPAFEVCRMTTIPTCLADGMRLPITRGPDWLRQNWSLFGTEDHEVRFCDSPEASQCVLPCALLESADGPEQRTEVGTGRVVRGFLLPLDSCQKWAAKRGMDILPGKVHITWPVPSWVKGESSLFPPVVVSTWENSSHMSQIHALAMVSRDKDFVFGE